MLNDNRSRWAPGVSGNPNGRPPKAWTIAEAIRSELLKTRVTLRKVKGKKKPIKLEVTKRDALVERLVDSAIKGNHYCAKIILEYVDGRPAQKIESVVEGSIIHTREFGRFRSLLVKLAEKYPGIKDDVAAYFNNEKV